MDINKLMPKIIQDKLDYKGESIELGIGFNNNEIIDLYEENKEDNIRISLKNYYASEHLVLSVLRHMIEQGEAKIEFTDLAEPNNIKYLDELLEEIDRELNKSI